MPESRQPKALAALKAAMGEITALNRAAAVLSWDQHTYMPSMGAAGRAEQLAAIRRSVHMRLTSPAMGALIERARDEATALDPESDDAALVRIAQRDYERSAKLPEELVVERARTGSLANRVWIEARRTNDFPSFAPWLRKSVELSRRTADYLGYTEHPFDALVEEREPGFTTARVRSLFSELRPALVDLVQRITPQVDSVDDSMLHRSYDEAVQERLGREIVTRFGYDFDRGRLDRTTHPFATALSGGDVRITTRYNPTFLPMSLMGTMHESGHAMYEQGIAPELDGTPLGRGTSSGVHESQSRMWENYVGRSRPFWNHWYPAVQAAFPEALAKVTIEDFYRAINKVHPSLIRVEADEVTYSLHIMLRFELEVAMFEGTVRPEDAPEAWNAAMHEYLGITPPNDTQGILQDIHWTWGLGGFQGYALGNIIAAQLWEAVMAAHADLPEQIGRGEFSTLLGWLRTNVHRYGRKLDPGTLIERATGAPLTTEPYIRYLREKFGGIYTL